METKSGSMVYITHRKPPFFNLTNSITLNHPSPSTIFLQACFTSRKPPSSNYIHLYSKHLPRCNSHAPYTQHSVVSLHCRSSMSLGSPSRCLGLSPQYTLPVPWGLIPLRSALQIWPTHVFRTSTGMNSYSNYLFTSKKGIHTNSNLEWPLH